MSGILRRNIPVLDDSGHFSRAWYESLITTQKDVSGLVSATLYADTGAVNAWAITSGLTAYSRGTVRYVKPLFANTSTAVTLNDTALGAKAVILSDGGLPTVGQFAAGVTVQVQYNGTAWEVVNFTATNSSIPGDFTVGGNLSVLGTITQIVSGIYTPTLFNTTNIAASTAAQCNYLRVFDRVFVSGQVSIDPTAAVASLLGMSLPVASNIGATTDLAGTAAATTVTDNAIGIHGDSANDRASFQWVAVDVTNHNFDFSFMYRVI